MRFEKFEFKNSSGKKIMFTCDGSKLANYFGANPKAPHFLTPIFFKKEVLDKYYNKPSEFSVSDGYLSRGIKWGIYIDNNAKDCVMVYLGYLGQLPYKEQQYWKLFNTIRGNSSEVSFKRNFKAEFCSPTDHALFFKERLIIFNEKWKKKFNWDLFRPLNEKDKHHLKTLKVPDKEQKEFDEVVLSLTKIIIDSLNVREMKKGLIFEEKDASISILDKFLQQKYRFSFPQLFTFLRNLQNLRSKGSAHTKGSDYIETYKKFDKGNLSKTFENILIHSITMINTIEKGVLNNEK